MKLSSFPRRRRIGAVCMILLAAQLAACGGGDDAPATPPPPAGNNPPPPPPPPATVSLTLEGRVTDEPIANAIVTATVGAETFTATADAAGSYSIEIEVAEANAGQFVTLSARGVGDQSFVEFTSLAGSLQSLAAQAGDDDTLSSSENFATQITNVSTAEAVLLRDANGGEPITTDATLQGLATSVNAQDVLDLAAAIKLAVDNAEEYPLPEGQTSILALASDPAARQAFVNDVYEQDPSAFAAVQAAIVQDSGLTQPIDPAQQLSFTAALLSTDPTFSFNYDGRAMHFELDEGGSGSVNSETYDVPLTWTIEGNTIRASYTVAAQSVSYDTEFCAADPEPATRQVEAHYSTTSATIAFISKNTVAITTTSDVTYADCASLEPRADVVNTQGRTILTMDSFQPIDAEELKGATQTIYVYDNAQGTVVADVADLVDGAGTTRLTNKSFTWTLDETGKIVRAEFTDGTVAEYLSLRDIDELASDLFWEIVMPNDGDAYMGIGATVFVDPQYAVSFTAADVPGRFYQFGVGAEEGNDDRLKGFRLRFDTDFMGAQEEDFIENDQVVTVDETVYSANGFRWTLESDQVVVRRTFDLVNQTYNCSFGQPDCLLWDERRIIPLAADAARVYWVEVRRSNNNGVTEETPATRLVRFYDYEPLTGAAGVGSSKSRLIRTGHKPRALLRGPQLR
jgi:hypothetical protein